MMNFKSVFPKFGIFFDRYRKFIIFGVIGALTALINLGTLFIFLGLFKFEYKVAVTFSYFLGVIFHFFTNKIITFNNNDYRSILKQLFRYAIMAVINYLISLFLVVVIVEKLGQPAYLGVLISIVFSAIIGFNLSKIWVFKQ